MQRPYCRQMCGEFYREHMRHFKCNDDKTRETRNYFSLSILCYDIEIDEENVVWVR